MTIPASHQSAPDFKVLAQPAAPVTLPPDVERWQKDAQRFYLEAARLKAAGQTNASRLLRARALRSLDKACAAMADAEVAKEGA